MPVRKKPAAPPRLASAFDAGAYLASHSVPHRVTEFQPRDVVFRQGGAATDVCYVLQGLVRLSVISRLGREAVLGLLGAGEFFGENVLAGVTSRIETATAVEPSTVLSIERATMSRLLHDEPTLSEGFISHMLARNLRIEADLVDQLFNSSERRLARALLLLARYADGPAEPERVVPTKVSQEVLAEMIGTTRSRVNFFMNKFRKLGLIEYNGKLTVKRALLTVVLHD